MRAKRCWNTLSALTTANLSEGFSNGYFHSYHPSRWYQSARVHARHCGAPFDAHLQARLNIAKTVIRQMLILVEDLAEAASREGELSGSVLAV